MENQVHSFSASPSHCIIVRQKKKTSWKLKLSIFIFMICAVVFIICDLSIRRLGYIMHSFRLLMEWMAIYPIAGTFVFALVFTISTVFFVPAPLLTLWAGFVFGCAFGLRFGILLGSLTIFVGAFVGGILSFLLGRFVLQDFCQKCFVRFKVLKAIDRAIETNSLKLMILLRLSPLIPFSVLNYVLGVSSVCLKDYAIGFIGIAPGTIAYVFVGASGGDLLQHNMGNGNVANREETVSSEGDFEEGQDTGSNLVTMLIFILGSVASIVAICIVTIISKRILKETLESSREAKYGAENMSSGLQDEESEWEAEGLEGELKEEEELF